MICVCWLGGGGEAGGVFVRCAIISSFCAFSAIVIGIYSYYLINDTLPSHILLTCSLK